MRSTRVILSCVRMPWVLRNCENWSDIYSPPQSVWRHESLNGNWFSNWHLKTLKVSNASPLDFRRNTQEKSWVRVIMYFDPSRAGVGSGPHKSECIRNSGWVTRVVAALGNSVTMFFGLDAYFADAFGELNGQKPVTNWFLVMWWRHAYLAWPNCWCQRLDWTAGFMVTEGQELVIWGWTRRAFGLTMQGDVEGKCLGQSRQSSLFLGASLYRGSHNMHDIFGY